MTGVGSSLGALRSWVAARWCTARGRRALRRGDLPQALEAFEMALSWRPGSFGPLLDLARGYLRARETWRAHRTLAQAREADPARFARVAPRWLAREGVDPETFANVLSLVRSEPREERMVSAAAPATALRGRVVSPQSLPYGDCRDLDEYARFRAMPPISDAERESIDWDRVLDDLLED